MSNKIIKAIKEPKKAFLYAMNKGFFNFLSDKAYLKLRFRLTMGKKLNLKSPKTFNEKLQWLKLYNRCPEYTVMVDKYLVRDYIAEVLGDEYLIPLVGAWDSADEVDFDSLPERFVLKCNHNSGLGMYICRNKSEMNVESVRDELRRGMAQDYYLSGREWPYKNVTRKIIAEQFMEDSSGGLIDYKFFCFDGYVDSVMVCLDRHLGDTKFYFFDKEWKLKRLNIRGKNAPEGFTIPKPDKMDEMFELAAKMSDGMPFVRVDLYQSNGQIYFGEMTFYPASGFDANLLPETDEYFCDLIKLK